MFTVDCSNYDATYYQDDDGVACDTSKFNSYEEDGFDSDVRVYKCYDECNISKNNDDHEAWSGGHCCDHYDNVDGQDKQFYIDKSTCTNCLCLDPDKTTIPGTYLHQGQVTSNLKLYIKLLQF